MRQRNLGGRGWLIALVMILVLSLGGLVAPASALPLSPMGPGATLPGLGTLLAGQRPSSLGVQDGHFAPCPSSPNCVSSQAPATDSAHAIAPLSYSGDAATALTTLKQVVLAGERVELIEATDTYLDFEVTSNLMGFVDDVEFYLDSAAGVIHMRSASRLGESDLGVNHDRLEQIRDRWAEAF